MPGRSERWGVRGATRLCRGAPSVGGLEERPGYAGALRTLGGLGGHFGAPLVHRPVIQQPEPAAGDPVDEPEPDDAERDPRDEEADAERGDDEQHAQPDPQRAEPERADLPAEVR